MTTGLTVPALQTRSLTRAFQTAGGPVHALRSATLSIFPGELAVIMGRSGSGKSTLLHIIGLMDRADGGELYLNGRAVSSLKTKERDAVRARHIGFVFQAFHLIEHRSVFQNVLMPLVYTRHPRRERRALTSAALETVGLQHRALALPRTLSGGEKQRAAVARALVHVPSLLLCDEPTGNLDRANADNVLSLLRTTADLGFAVIIVTHDPAVVQVADRVYNMSDGYLSESPASHNCVPHAIRT